MKYLDDLFFWVNERERIRLKQETGERRPWTQDPVLNTYRFCNVHREDDRVTKWIHSNWLRPNVHHHNLAFSMCVARMVNLPSTLEKLGFPYIWSPEHFIATIGQIKADKQKAWTSAYMITGGYSAGGESKEVIIARVLTQAHSNLKTTHGFIAKGDSLAVAAEKILCPGIGSFLSAQVVADLKHTPLLKDAKDWNSWCSPGPGSTMGLNFLHGRQQLQSIHAEDFRKEVWEVQELLRHQGTVLDAQNTQNCLCEFSKYVRAKHFGQRLKSTYQPA